MSGQAVIVMLTDEQLDAEIVDTVEELCCPDWTTAARRLCGCGGGAAEYLTRLRAEARRRDCEVVSC